MGISYSILFGYESLFEKFSFFLARRPLAILIASLIVVVTCCLGLSRVSIQKPEVEHFTVIDSQSRQDLSRAAQFFPLLEARREQIIMTAKHGQNILSGDCLKDAVFVHKAVLNISGYQKLCFRQQVPQNTSKTSVKQDCVISSPLEFAGDHFEHLSNISSILVQESTITRAVPGSETGQSSFREMISNFRVRNKTDPLTARADALRIVYFLIKATTDEEDQKVVSFERSFERLVLSIRHRLKCASLSFETGKTKTDVLQNVLKLELKSLYLSALVMIALAFTVTYFSSTILNCLTTVFLLFSSVLSPLVCFAGIVSIANISPSPTTLFIPFLLLGKVASDVVLFLGEWERQKEIKSLEHRVSSCVTKAGILHVLSSLCGTILLGIVIKSSFDVISRFFLMALVAYVLVTVASVLITVTLVSCLKSQSAKTLCLLSCSRRSPFLSVTSFGGGPIQQLQVTLRTFRESVTKMLMSFAGKVIAVIILAGIVSLCVLSASRSGGRAGTTQNLYHQDDNFKKFNEAQEKFFGNETDVSIVFSEKVEYSHQTVQNEIITICRTLEEASYSHRKSSCWMAALLLWAKQHNTSCLNSEFYLCLKSFLNQPSSFFYQRDVRFEDNHSRLLASRIRLDMVLHNHFKEDRRTLEKLREKLSTQSSLKTAPVSEKFFKIDDLYLLEKEALFVLVTASVVVFVFCLLSSSSFGISAYLAVTFDLLVFETASIMEACRIRLNPISFISLVFSVVLALNFSLQMAYSFIFSGKQKIAQRAIEAFHAVSGSVIAAALLEISGSLSLGFIYPSLQDVFFQLVPLVFALGLIHAIVIFPPVVTLIFEVIDNFYAENELNRLLNIKKGIQEKYLKVPDCDAPQRQAKSKRPALSIIGISCRFPGANSKDMFWNLLEQGKSSIRAFPQNRAGLHETFLKYYHPKRFVSGRHCAVNGSYLEEIQTFDNSFFGISSQEARGMDPQQRILLEVVYEAIEDAGMRLEDLQKCKTGVFVGAMTLEYGNHLVSDPSNYQSIDKFSSTGMAGSILANRVSFCLNLTGPSIAVDTACSSSLTALKLACDNLHNGDCNVAIVCAPNIVLNYCVQMVSSMAGLLAPDGRSKSFDASGNGYGRGEGFAAVILKLSEAALSDKDDEYCHITACGMNSDGKNAVPITAPSAKIQAELSRMVLEQSGVSVEDVDYFEAHGTGTAIGDVIEVASIADTYTKRTKNPIRKLRIGSVKSNLNHTESASGLAGLIKVALMIKKKRFVPTVNVHVLNPKLKLEERGLVVQQTNEPWITENEKPRIAAVNSFGFGGSNVHAICKEVSSHQRSEEEKVPRLNHVLTMSARSQEALKRMAKCYSEWLKDKRENVDKTFVEDLCYSLNERRSQFPHRLALPFGFVSEASKYLTEYADNSIGLEKLVSHGEVKSSDPRVVFMFGGQGSQWYAMGRQLIETEPVFKESIITVSKLVRNLGKPWSLMVELMVTEDKSRISENSISQPATFAIQYATAQLLMSWKIHPSAVVGHSLGEFAAACIAGIITLKEAVQLVLTRSTLQDQCPHNGGMAALGMSEESARSLMTELKLNSLLSIAAVNDANSVTVSGDSQSIEALGKHLAIHSSHTFWRILDTRRAFHSSHMELIRKPFQAATKQMKLKPQLSKIPMYSTVEGEVISGEQLDRDYWWRNIRCPVQFYPAVNHLLKDGYKQIIEISMQPILSHYVKQIAMQEKLQDRAVPVVFATLPSKRIPVSDQHRTFLLNTVCKLYTRGFPIEWACVQSNPSAKFVRSVTYPWVKNSFWYRESPPQTTIPTVIGDKRTTSKTHPFLEKTRMTELYSGLDCWETEIDLHRFPHIKDHALIKGGAVMAGAAYVEMAFAMVRDKFVDVAGLELSDVKLLSLLTLPENKVNNFQYTVQYSMR